jgi:glycosyltransferase involved in cell wall biosynthesis
MRIDNPLVSVLMTAYNRELYIAEAIESVLAQDYENFELIIVDDCSSDNTLEIAKSYQTKDSRIQVYVNEKNLGQFPNRNYAASICKGEFLVYVDSDDTINKDALSYIVKEFEKYTDAHFSTIYQKKDIQDSVTISSHEAIKKHFFEGSFLHIGPGGTVIKKSFFDKIGGFVNDYGPVGDMYYNIKAASNSNVILLPYDYLNYRQHENQELNNPFEYLYYGYRYFDDMLLLEDLPLTKKQIYFFRKKNKRRFLLNLIKYYTKERNFGEIKIAIKLARFKIQDFFIAIFQL